MRPWGSDAPFGPESTFWASLNPFKLEIYGHAGLANDPACIKWMQDWKLLERYEHDA